MLYAIFFLLVAGAEAIAIRIQLIQPNMHFISPQVFNRLFTMHGTTMVFLVGMTYIFGFAKLPDSPDDRRARHGLSAAECFQLLDDLFRRHSAVLQLHRRRVVFTGRAMLRTRCGGPMRRSLSAHSHLATPLTTGRSL